MSLFRLRPHRFIVALASAAILVTNALGNVTSASAVAQTIIQPLPPCAGPADGLRAWWPLDRDAQDRLGVSHGTLAGSSRFTNEQGRVGMVFDGQNDHVAVPASSVLDIGSGEGMTIELWIKPSNVTARPIVEWRSDWASPEVGPELGVHFWHSFGAAGSLFINVMDASRQNNFIMSTPAGTLHAGEFQHLAFTYDRSSGAANFYRNGEEVASATWASFRPQTSFNFHVGMRSGGLSTERYFAGMLDEISLYHRALAISEVRAIYEAGVVGKCEVRAAPVVVIEPVGLDLESGQIAEFMVKALHAATWQWWFGSQLLTGQTNQVLHLDNVQTNQAGRYFVVVANAFGTVTSAVAHLTVAIPPVCQPVPPTLANAWPLEGNLSGLRNVGSGELFGQPRAVTGKVQVGLEFDGLDDHAIIRSSSLTDAGAGDGLTIEFWIRPKSIVLTQPILHWLDAATSGVQVWHSRAGRGSLWINLRGINGADNAVETPAGTIRTNEWNHVAFTYERSTGSVRIYHNGMLMGDRVVGSYQPLTKGDLVLGLLEEPGDQRRYAGELDELALYARALHPEEIQSIYEAQSGGKCPPSSWPEILAHPENLDLREGQIARFEVNAANAQSYQWLGDGQPLLGETNSSLVRTNIQIADVGSYAVVINGNGGAVTSRLAHLIVTTQTCRPDPRGLVAHWPLEGNAVEVLSGQAATLTREPTATNGWVRSALFFDGVDDQIRIAPTSTTDLGAFSGFTIEFWFNPARRTAALIEWNSGVGVGSPGMHLWTGGSDVLFATFLGTNGQSGSLETPANRVRRGEFQHVALTYDRNTGVATFYHNGARVSTANVGSLRMETTFPVFLGSRPLGQVSEAGFEGVLDEVSFYSRSLAESEIAHIFQASTGGKCLMPSPPVIVEQPLAVEVATRQFHAFSARALGSDPMWTQWLFNNEALLGETNLTLFLHNIALSNAGLYSLRFSNSLGVITSTEAALSVRPPVPCRQQPAGLVAWWPLNENTFAVGGTFPGTLQGGARFANAHVFTGLRLDGIDDYVAITVSNSSPLNLGLGGGFTIELWVRPDSIAKPQALVEWNQGITLGVHLWLDGADLFANLVDVGKNNHFIKAPNMATAGVFQHVALTYDRAAGEARLFHNGTLAATVSVGTFQAQTALPLYFGRRPSYPPFAGILDEVAFYQRALLPEEIEMIYQTQAGGKCNAFDPVITTQPEDVLAQLGSNVLFQVAASGIPPLRYQWERDGFPLLDATNATLNLEGVDWGDEGSYRLVVSQVDGTSTSRVARLVVSLPPECLPYPENVAAGWRFENNSAEAFGNPALGLRGVPTFASGVAGQGIAFDSTSSPISVAASPLIDVGAGPGLTIEFWMNPTTLDAAPIIDWTASGPSPTVFIWHSFTAPGSLYINLGSSPGNTFATTNLLRTGVFQHVALTYDRNAGLARVYCNGVEVQVTRVGSFQPPTSSDLHLGYQPSLFDPAAHFHGVLDEVALYHRALFPEEIRAIFLAAEKGKCAGAGAPMIVMPPVNATVISGYPAQFRAFAIGERPMTYQWLFDGQPLSAQTNTTLDFAMTDAAQDGHYAVSISNVSGVVTSTTVRLIVQPLPPCVSVGLGLQAWWPFEHSLSDLFGSRPSSVLKPATFVPGAVGRAWSFVGPDDQLQMLASSSLDIGAGSGLTIECWSKPSPQGPILEYGDGITADILVYFEQGNLVVNLRDHEGQDHVFTVLQFALPDADFHHLALTYDRASGLARVYRDGAEVFSTLLGSFRAETARNLYLGRRPSGMLGAIGGLVDELALYNRALLPEEIRAIFHANGAGKCRGDGLPIIVEQPVGVTINSGEAFSFSVLANGGSPLSYQWTFNGVPLASETRAWLERAMGQPEHEGAYSVIVSNSYGSVISATVQFAVRRLGGHIGISGPNENGRVHLHFQGLPMTLYRFEMSTDLHAWQEIHAENTNADGEAVFDDDVVPSNSRFYRVVGP